MELAVLLEKVKSLYFKYGIKTVSMDDVSRHLGISKKTLYQIVENKSDLVEQIFEKYIFEQQQELSQIIEQSENAIVGMVESSKYVTTMLREISPVTIYDMSKYYKDIFMKIEKMHHVFFYNIIRANIERGMKEGLYRSDLNADILSKLYLGKNSLVVDEDVFPLKEYSTENLYITHIKYHIYGIASQKGIKLFEKITDEFCCNESK